MWWNRKVSGKLRRFSKYLTVAPSQYTIKRMNILTKMVEMTETIILTPKPIVEDSPIGNSLPLADRNVFNMLQLKKHNAIVAGGAALSWYCGKPVGFRDIDIWVKSQSDFEKVESHFKTIFGMPNFDTKNALTFLFESENREYKIQMIKTKFYSDPKILINSFDITVCSIATDGNSWFLGKDFSQDLKNKALRVRNYTPSIMKRVVKYWQYGFQPTDELLDMIANNKNTIWQFENNSAIGDDYDNAF